MNRSYTKIRKIQEANMNLEQRRVLNEQQNTGTPQQTNMGDIERKLNNKGFSKTNTTENTLAKTFDNRLKNKLPSSWNKENLQYFKTTSGDYEFVTDGVNVFFYKRPEEMGIRDIITIDMVLRSTVTFK